MSPGMAEIPEGAVVITTADIYRQLISMSQELNELKGAVGKIAERERDIDDHEARLRALEKGRWPLPSLAMLVSLAALIAPLIASK